MITCCTAVHRVDTYPREPNKTHSEFHVCSRRNRGPALLQYLMLSCSNQTGLNLQDLTASLQTRLTHSRSVFFLYTMFSLSKSSSPPFLSPSRLFDQSASFVL